MKMKKGQKLSQSAELNKMGNRKMTLIKFTASICFSAFQSTLQTSIKIKTE